jgi:hypothetical protein
VRVPTPDEYESPRATYFVAIAELAKMAQIAAAAQRTAEMRLHCMMLLLEMIRAPLPRKPLPTLNPELAGRPNRQHFLNIPEEVRSAAEHPL